MKVMVVDDEPDIVDLLSLILESEGYDVITACGGSECLEKLQQDMPDLILLDLIMTNIDGWAVLSRIRQDDRLKSIPVVILTAKQLTAEVVQKKAPYMTEYLVKPITKEGLISVIKNIMYSSKELEDFIAVARKTGVDRGMINKYVQLDQQTGTYKQLHTSLVQIYTKKKLEREKSIKNTMGSIKRLIDLRERDLTKLHSRIEVLVNASR